nr:MAG TPA: TREPONEMA DENTICOLA VARIABLE PROTEIN 1 FUNCTION, PERIODONTAL DISEASE [Caudoviricetes sp.]
MAKKVYDEDGLDMQKTDWSGDESTGNLPVSGRLVENYIKSIDDKATPTEELVAGETKAPTSGAVFASLVGTVTNIDVTDSEDGTQYVMTVTQKDGEGGESDREVRFSKYSDDDKVVVNIDLTDASGSSLPASQYLSLGTGFVVRYAVGVGTAGGGEVSGYSDLKAKVVVKRGSTVLSEFQDAEFVGVTAGQSYTFDASPYLKDATTYTVQVEAQAGYDGGTLMKTATARVTMVAMELSTTYSVGNGLADGGYRNDVNIPFTAKGTSGEKNIYYRINGGQPYTLGLSAGSGVQQKNVTVALSEMREGMNVVEAYALHENSGVVSEIHYLTLLKAGEGVTAYAGMMFNHRAAGFQRDWKHPVLEAEQFTAWNFTYAGYDRDAYTARVKVTSRGSVVKEDLLQRGETGSYGRTNVNVEPLDYRVSCGDAVLEVQVNTTSHPDIEATLAPDAVCTFDAFGRSNTENNPESWVSGDKRMEFRDVLWSVNEYGAGSGWHKDRLLLAGGAGMTLTADGGYRPFNEADKPEGFAIRDVGMTLEIEYSTANVTDTDAELITCLGTLQNGNRYGLVVTPEEAKFLTGVVTEAMDAGQVLRYEDSVGTKFEPGKNIRITYVFYPDVETNEQRTLIGFYVNGEESAASKWLDKVSFDIRSQLEFKSEGADLNVKSVRIYNKALTSDEVLNNYIVDRNHLEDADGEPGVRSLDEDNRVLNEGDTVSMEKLMGLMKKRRNSILVLIGTGSVGSEVPSESDTLNVMDALAQLNNKKANKLCREVRFYNGENRALDWIARDIYLRIQGTSSVNYARKNLRFYFQKTASGYTARMSYGEIDGNGQQSNPTATEGKKNLFRLRDNSVGAKLACAKCDFSDSSMTTNTGGAKFIHDGMKEMGILTPAQQYAADHADTCKEDIRSAIDGLPCDLFVAKSVDEDLTYYGQYNMNNEKSDSYPIFGQDKTIGEEQWGTGDTLNYLQANGDRPKEYLPICIETLNNSNDLCLFRWLPSTEPDHMDFMDFNFDGGFEFNHPKDVFWNDGGGDAEEEPNIKEHLGTGDKYDKMYKALDRMMSFLYKCVKETPAGKGMTYNKETHTFDGVDYEDDGNKFPTAKWVSPTFKAEAGKYFNLPNLAAYYLYVQFNLGVDQLAKNMLVRTWDGVMWWITYYDGDCQLGSDNKSFLTGKYDDNRQTKRDGAYVMQGHNSWLWNLILGNMGNLLEEVMTRGVNGGTSFMSAFSIQKAVDHFDTEQMKRWCSRLYNKSGIFKYVYPFLNEMPVGADGAKQTYPQIYGLKGSLKAHRNYFIQRRYDLKQVEYGYVSTLGAQFYQSTASLDKAYKLKPMQYRLTIPYRVQLSTSNGVQADSGVVDADVLHSLQLARAFGENDPLKIIGAAKIKELVWHEDAFAIGFNFGLLTSLVKLDMSVEKASGYRNGSFMASTNGMLLLEELNMRNNLLARNGDNGNVTTLDLSWQGRLKKLDVRGTGLTRVKLATGAPVVQLCLPETIEELFLEYLPRLAESGLVLDGIGNVRGYRFMGCPGIDGFAMLERLHQAKLNGSGKLERFVLDIDMEDDGRLLGKYYDYGTYTSTGAIDNRHSGLRGRLRLTKYMEDEEADRYRERYPELEIVQPAYSIIESDESAPDDANISNPDNETGYKYGNTYVMNAHVAAILKKRHRVLAKVTKKPTSRKVEMAGQTVDVNNPDGEMTYCPLDDTSSNKYYDGSAAKLDSSEGDWMMYEPFFWSKGVNDYLNEKYYSCYSSNGPDDMPPVPDVTVLTLDDIKGTQGGFLTERKLLSGKPTLKDSYSTDKTYSVCKVDVQGYKRVRFPSVPGTGLVGSLFVDGSGNVVKTIVVPTIGLKFEAGMYLISDVPEDATALHFSILNTAEFDKVVLSNSDKIEDMEPDWVANEEHLCAVVGSSVVGSKLRSCITGNSTTASMNWIDFHYYSQQRGMQQIDALMHSRIANLFYARYGRRDSQEQCGGGQHTNNRITGGTAGYGMQDTIGYDEAYKINNKITNSLVDNNQIHQYAWYRGQDEYGSPTVTQVNNISCLGYEDIYGHKYDMMDGVDLPNDSGNSGKWRIWMPDGSIRFVKGKTSSDQWIVGVAHGKYMDMVPVGSANGSSSTYYCDKYYISTAACRVVFRGCSDAIAHGGVSYANADNDASSSGSYLGSRLAFRGRIVKAESVEAYKALSEKA